MGKKLMLVSIVILAGLTGACLWMLLSRPEKPAQAEEPDREGREELPVLTSMSRQEASEPLPPEPSAEVPAEASTATTTEAPPETTAEAPVEVSTAAPTDAPPEPEDPIPAEALGYLQQMTLREKLCQLMIVSPDAITGVSPTTVAGERSRQALADYPVGGLMLSRPHLVNRDQTQALLAGMQSFAKYGLILSVDEEGGTVWRVMGNPAMGTTWLDSMYSYREEGPARAYENAYTIGTDLAALGFNLDFAPVADVWSNPANTVIGSRAYSDSFLQAAELIPAAVRGFQDGGVACTLKHFPGHGSTVTDSHKGLPVLDQTASDLQTAELVPFRAGIEAGADLVMVGHLLVPALDPELPASLSRPIVTGLLREELNFEGLIITDAIGMGALQDRPEAENCLLALEAGVDLLLCVEDVPGTLAELEAAVADGRLSEERIDESVLRILEFKLRRGILLPGD